MTRLNANNCKLEKPISVTVSPLRDLLCLPNKREPRSSHWMAVGWFTCEIVQLRAGDVDEARQIRRSTQIQLRPLSPMWRLERRAGTPEPPPYLLSVNDVFRCLSEVQAPCQSVHYAQQIALAAKNRTLL